MFTVLALGRRAVAVTTEADAGPLAPAAATVTVTGVLPLAGPAGKILGPLVLGPFAFQVQRAVAAATASTWHWQPEPESAWDVASMGLRSLQLETQKPTGAPELGFSFKFSSVLYCTPGGVGNTHCPETPPHPTTRREVSRLWA
jgi:hypothetical protein